MAKPGRRANDRRVLVYEVPGILVSVFIAVREITHMCPAPSILFPSVSPATADDGMGKEKKTKTNEYQRVFYSGVPFAEHVSGAIRIRQ